jgi:hypothetical protein
MRIAVFECSRRVESMLDTRSLSRAAKRVAGLGDSAASLGTIVALLLVGIGVTFACLINEPIYHRLGSGVILGLLPGVLVHATGRLLRGCMIAASLVYDPLDVLLSRATRHAANGGGRIARRIGKYAAILAAAVLRSLRHAWSQWGSDSRARRELRRTRPNPASARAAPWYSGELPTHRPATIPAISHRPRLRARA